MHTTRELYGIYVNRFSSCQRTPYQAEYYRKWLDLLNSCSSNEEAEEKSKQNGLYTAGAAAVAMDRLYANRQAAQEMGWTDVAAFCDDILQKLQDDPYYTYTHSSFWIDLQGKKAPWLRTIEGFHRLFVDFMEYDDSRTEPDRALTNIATDLKLLSKPCGDFATLAAMPQFRILIACSDYYYNQFVNTIIQAERTGHLDSIPWSTEAQKDQIAELWENKSAIADECIHWYNQEVKPVCVRLSPITPDGKYQLIDIN